MYFSKPEIKNQHKKIIDSTEPLFNGIFKQSVQIA